VLRIFFDDTRALLRAVIRDRWPIVSTHLVYTIIGLVIFFPAIGLVARLALTLSGKTALTNMDILFFALRPLGAVTLVLLGALFLFVFAFEQAALSTIAMGAQSASHITASGAIRHSLRQANPLLGFAWRLLIRLLLITLPFVVVAAGVFLSLLTEYDINFYLKTKPPEFWTAATLILVVIASMSIALVRKLFDWSVSLPLVLFGSTPPARCFRESAVAMKGNRRHLLANLATWAGAALIMSAVMILIMWLVGTILVPLAIDSIQWLLFVLGGMVAIGAIGGFVVAAFTSGGFAYVIIYTFFHVVPEVAKSASVASSVQTATSKIARLTTRKAALLLIAGVTVAGLTGYWLINSVPIDDDVYVIAHRGASGRAPENTIAAIHAAIEDEAGWIEIDVQETADGEIVLLHDSDFMKLAGVDLKIWDGTLQQVREIDVGSWFDSEFADQRPPTLAEVLRIVKGRGRLIIEFKYYGHDERLEERVIELVEQADMVNDVMIMSLEHKGVRKMRELRPDWTVGLLAAQAAGNLAQLDVDFLAVKSGLVMPELILAAKNSGKQVFVWTLNDAYSMTRAISLGVDGIITDEPMLARQVLEERAALTPTEHLLLHTALLLGQQPPTRSYRDDSP